MYVHVLRVVFWSPAKGDRYTQVVFRSVVALFLYKSVLFHWPKVTIAIDLSDATRRYVARSSQGSESSVASASGPGAVTCISAAAATEGARPGARTRLCLAVTGHITGRCRLWNNHNQQQRAKYSIEHLVYALWRHAIVLAVKNFLIFDRHSSDIFYVVYYMYLNASWFTVALKWAYCDTTTAATQSATGDIWIRK